MSFFAIKMLKKIESQNLLTHLYLKTFYINLLWTFQISVYDLVLMEVVHPSGDLLGPLHQLLGRHLLAVPEQIEEGAVGAVLHDDAEHRGLDTHALELHNVGVVELPEVLDVSLVFLLDLLDGHLLLAEGPGEHGALGPGAQPPEVLDLLEGNFPVIPYN